MPLFGNPKKPIQKKGIAIALEEQWPENKQVYYLPTTKEVFDDYEEYVNRAIMYKLQIWSCQYSGKDFLTYDEALQSEKDQKDQYLFKLYPKYITKHICYMVHHSNKGETIEQLASRISKFFEYNFIEGEELFCELDNTISVVLRRILLKKQPYYDINFPPFSTPLFITDAEQNQIEVFHQTKEQEHFYDNIPNSIGFGAQNKLYEVEIVSNNTPFENRIIVVYYNVLLRKQSCLIESIEKLTKWIRDNTTFDIDNDLLLLKPEYVEYFKMEPRTPNQCEKKTAYQLMVEEEMEDINRIKKGKVKSLNDLKYHHIDKSGRLITDLKEIENYLIRKNIGEESTEQQQSSSNSKKSVVTEIKPPFIPNKDGTIPDEYITYRDPGKQDKDIPSLHFDYTLQPNNLIPEALHIFNFILMFRDILKITPFSFDEFQHSLMYKGKDNNLLKAILSVIILYYIADKSVNKNDVNKAIYRMKKLFNEIREPELHIMNTHSRKNVVNKEAATYMLDHKPTLVLREFWKVFLHVDQSVLEEEIEETNGNNEEEIKTETNDNGEDNNGNNTQIKTENDETNTTVVNTESVKTEETEMKVENPVKLENQPEVNVKTEEKDESKELPTSAKKEEPRDVYTISMRFLLDQNYGNEYEVDLLSDTEADVRLYFLSELVSLCLSTTTMRDTVERNIENRRKITKLKNNENAQEAEKLKEENNEAPENDKKELNGDTIKDNKEHREKLHQLIIKQYATRTRPLGYDRFFNKYWFFYTFTGLLFVEPLQMFRNISNSEYDNPPIPLPWGYYETKEELDKLISFLDTRGSREKQLLKSLQKHYDEIVSHMNTRLKVIKGISLVESSIKMDTTGEVTINGSKTSSSHENGSTMEEEENVEDMSEEEEEKEVKPRRSSRLKKRKEMESEEEGNGKPKTKKTKMKTAKETPKSIEEQTLEELVKQIREYKPTQFSSDSFKTYRNELKEEVPKDSEAFIIEEEE
ncbi:hypothetical protein ABK040_016728 [Willaertia magna]